MNFFFWIAASIADIAVGIPNGNKTLLAKGVSTLFIQLILVLHFLLIFFPFFSPLFNASTPVRNITCGIAASKSARIPSDRIIIDNWVFENVILADESFAKLLGIFETGVSDNNNLC